VKAIEEICAEHKVTLRQAAIQFAYGHPAVVSVVLGAVKPEEVKSNLQDATVEIPAGLWSDLKSAKLLDSAAPTKG
jgi:D-threo-aldose 1-dehydrogenase